MKNKNSFQKIVFIALIIVIIIGLVAPVIFSQTSAAPKQQTLLNGLKLLLWSDAKADKVNLSVRIHSGSAFDPQGREGVMQMLADNIFPNEASKDFFVEDLGGDLSITTTYDHIQIDASAKPEHLQQMIETIAAALSTPVIDRETTAKLKAATLERIKMLESDPAYVADRAAAKRLLGVFPYGRPIAGTADSVDSIGFADLIDARQKFLTADNATVTISGNFERSFAYMAVRRFFGPWTKSDKNIPSTFKQPDVPPTALLTINSPKPDVSVIRFAFRGVARNDKDLAASMIFTQILESRLKARVPAAHADDVFARNETHYLPGIVFIGFAATRGELTGGNGKIESTELVSKAIADPVAEAEFNAARDTVADKWGKRNTSDIWLDLDTYKLPSVEADRSRIRNAKLSDVRSYAERVKAMPSVAVLVNTPPPPATK